jgi:hypothetical protein
MSRPALAAACGLLVLCPVTARLASPQTPLGTSFTYQGRLVESGSPANGTYDFRFILYDAPAGGSQVGPVVTREDVFVSTGLFTVGVDFGAVFANQRRFLEVGVRPGASTGAYDVVSGRHELSAAPSALFGATAPWAGVTGKPAGFADDIDNDSGGDITSVTAGTGLSGGGTSGVVTLSANFGGGGAATTVARSDHDHFGQAWAPAVAPAADGLTVNTNNAAANRNAILGIHNAPSTGYGIRGRTVSTSGGAGVFGEATATGPGSSGYGVRGTSSTQLGTGVWGSATAGGTGLGWGVQGTANMGGGRGVLGHASATTGLAYGVEGISDSSAGRGVGGRATATGGETYGVHGVSASSVGRGVWGETTSIFGATWGVRGSSASTAGRGVYGEASATTGFAVGAQGISDSTGGIGVVGRALATVGNNFGVFGTNESTDGGGVFGRAHGTTGATTGVLGIAFSPQGTGVSGIATATTGPTQTTGVYGETRSTTFGSGVYGFAAATAGVAYGVYGRTASSDGIAGYFEAQGGGHYAGYFDGRVHVAGLLTKSGGLFRIDHPLDPENKILNHSFVESPDMMNVYNGNVTTDGDGYAVVLLPDWFEALNRDFRYQLTVLDEGDSAVFVQVKVVKKVEGNRFTIRTSMPGAEVSWQITGIRHDPFAEKRRVPVEEEKPAAWRGKYLNPVEWGVPKERGIHHSPRRPPAEEPQFPRSGEEEESR